MAIRDFMTLGIGGRRHIQPDFAVTKLVTVLIFAIFCPEGISRGLDKASIAANFSIGWLGGDRARERGVRRRIACCRRQPNLTPS